MNDYAEQWNQIQRESVKKTAVKKTSSKVEISMLEWFSMFFIAGIADLLGPFGFPFAIVLCSWYFFKFHKFPTKKLIGSGTVELISAGFLPGWLGFVVSTYIETKI